MQPIQIRLVECLARLNASIQLLRRMLSDLSRPVEIRELAEDGLQVKCLYRERVVKVLNLRYGISPEGI